ncbi:MAG: ribonuclease HI [Clostridiaceae bacterium]|nr:ribonuclease HI [Clostridiaceae bacterium]
MPEVFVYTDGACSGNPGPGGWGAVLVCAGREKEVSGGERSTTNNRMELVAAIEAMNLLKQPCRVRVFSDSAYLVNAFRLGWIDNWKRNGWKNSARETVSNLDLWKDLDRLSSIHQIEWIKVKGHSGHEYNERCDVLATSKASEFSKSERTEHEQ